MSTPDATAAPADAQAPGLRREAWGLFWRVFLADKTRRWQALSALGLTPAQGQALMALDPEAPMPMSALAERLQCDNSNITGIADRLEAIGVVARRPAPHDRRVKALELTERGRALRERVADEAGRPPEGFDALDERDAEQLRDLLARVAAAQPGA